MMSATEYLAKAHSAQANAKGALDPQTRLHWTAIVDQWLVLAKVATAQEAVERGLPDESPLSWMFPPH